MAPLQQIQGTLVIQTALELLVQRHLANLLHAAFELGYFGLTHPKSDKFSKVSKCGWTS